MLQELTKIFDVGTSVLDRLLRSLLNRQLLLQSAASKSPRPSLCQENRDQTPSKRPIDWTLRILVQAYARLDLCLHLYTHAHTLKLVDVCVSRCAKRRTCMQKYIVSDSVQHEMNSKRRRYRELVWDVHRFLDVFRLNSRVSGTQNVNCYDLM